MKKSRELELLDSDNIPFEDIEQNMQELNVINTLLGGHAITINGLKQLLVDKEFKSNNSLLVCEIGCGGGDNLNAIYNSLKIKLPIQMIGVDIKGACLLSAKKKYPLLPANWIENSYEKTTFQQQPDIIFSSLFCHHFSDEALVYQLKWMYENATIGFFINDLHRHPLAYYSIKWLTKLFSKSYLVKNDAPLSVKRGFTKQEWQLLLQKACISDYSIQWKWAFRYLIIVHK
jgi:2-polyprenyl-3-methyl-5-hydroxy-6-metoxy-1,4-benzoquinol methylase